MITETIENGRSKVTEQLLDVEWSSDEFICSPGFIAESEFTNKCLLTYLSGR